MADEMRRVDLVLPADDPVLAIHQWRTDSQNLARILPIVAQLQRVDAERCRFEEDSWPGHTCLDRDDGLTCAPCAVRNVRTALFGAPNEGAT